MRRIVIVGGGYAGLHAFAQISAASAAASGPARCQLTLVAKDPYHTYHGWTGEVLSGRLSVRSTLTILPTLLRGQYVEGEVSKVDPDRKVVQVTTPDGVERELPYDQVLVATGSRDPFSRLPGFAEHGWCFKNTRDMQRLIDHLTDFTGQSRRGGGRRHGRRRNGVGAARALPSTRPATCRSSSSPSGDDCSASCSRASARLAEHGTHILEEQGITIRRGVRVTPSARMGLFSKTATSSSRT